MQWLRFALAESSTWARRLANREEEQWWGWGGGMEIVSLPPNLFRPQDEFFYFLFFLGKVRRPAAADVKTAQGPRRILLLFQLATV